MLPFWILVWLVLVALLDIYHDSVVLGMVACAPAHVISPVVAEDLSCRWTMLLSNLCFCMSVWRRIVYKLFEL